MPKRSNDWGGDLPRPRRSAPCRLPAVKVTRRGLAGSGRGTSPSTRLRPEDLRAVHEQAAALLHSVVPDHPLVDGNKRLGLASLIALYAMNDLRLILTNDEPYELPHRSGEPFH